VTAIGISIENQRNLRAFCAALCAARVCARSTRARGTRALAAPSRLYAATVFIRAYIWRHSEK
jgi:hypothetical protein